MNPINYAKKCLSTNSQNPIIFALDVTGSMGDWAKVGHILINTIIIILLQPIIYQLKFYLYVRKKFK